MPGDGATAEVCESSAGAQTEIYFTNLHSNTHRKQETGAFYCEIRWKPVKRRVRVQQQTFERSRADIILSVVNHDGTTVLPVGLTVFVSPVARRWQDDPHTLPVSVLREGQSR